MNKEQFIKAVEELGIKLSPKQLEDLEIYCNFLLETNKHTNLTAIKEKDQVYLKHFYDSLTIIKALDFNNVNNLIDIGTGAGFPGMVLKIIFPNINITLLDSNNKKISFLQELNKKLGYNDLNFFHGRAEDFCKNHRESFDIVTGRAVSNMTTLSELCLPLTKINGYFIALKGSNYEEVEEALFAIKTLGGNIEQTYSFTLPVEESERNIIKIKKVKATPIQYPRRYEKIIKNPLKNYGK